MKYEQFLFSNLLREYSFEFSELPYDEQYEGIGEQYAKFEQSKYNVDTKGLYECMVDYLENL